MFARPLTPCNPIECVYFVQEGGLWKSEMGRRIKFEVCRL
jgi:hypothetical protein